MRMELERDVSSSASAEEGSMVPETAQKAAERLREVTEERQHWISKRNEALARKEKLLKLLKLQKKPKDPTDEPIEAQTTNNEEKTAAQNEDNVAKKEAADLARKKELKELKERAEAAREKQQTAASLLTRNLKHLQAKRKREEKEAEGEQPSKKADVGDNKAVTAPEMHPFAAAPDLDVGSAELAASACFRIATRHFVQTGTVISKETLERAFKTYTGKELKETVESSLLERSLACFDVDTTSRSFSSFTERARRRSVSWQPGRQFLKTPTFVSSDASQIQTLIQVEKEVVDAVCNSLRPLNQQKDVAFVRRGRQKHFMANLLEGGAATPVLSDVLAACVGVNLMRSTPGNYSRISYRSHGQMARVFEKMETWLSEQTETSETHNTLSPSLEGFDGPHGVRENAFSSKYSTPFCVANDSVVRQLRGVTRKPATSAGFDPMKILCHYELNGVCNDKNCSNYHQKDYNPVESEMSNISDYAGYDDDVEVLTTDEMDQLLLSFVEFRERIMSKWPVIPTTQTASVTTERNNDATSASVSSRADAVMPVTQDKEGNNGGLEEETDDFIVLESREDLPETADARYFDDIDARKTYGDHLQEKVTEDPSDTDSWLLLAIYQLELEVGLSDESVNISDGTWLQQQLIFVCKELNVKQRSGTFGMLSVTEANLTRCLHSLSRALEIEANAYCEALWLLYLHLCRQVTNKQTEIDMAEQAVQFLPSSHALWLRYISIYDFDTVSMAEGVYWRLLEHLARPISAGDGLSASNLTPTKGLSILLTAISFHLCIKLWRAGATGRVLELLSALLQIGDTSSEFGWCGVVRGRLRSDELVALYLVFAHVLLFEELPGVVEHWIAASNYEDLPIKKMMYTVETLRRARHHVEEGVFDQVLASYELAFQTFEKEYNGVQDAGSTILNNWMLLLSLQDDTRKKKESLRTFFQEKFDTIQQYPAAFLAAVKVVGIESNSEQQAHQLMRAVMNQNSKTRFPEALHHYLFACRQSPALVGALDETFPDVMKRLASFLDVDTDNVENSIQDIMRDTSKISKSRALKVLLEALLAAWMNQLALLRREVNQDQTTDPKAMPLVDIYVALDVCHLMGVLVEPSVAIDGVQMVLSSSGFGALSVEARHLAWMQRFVFEVDLLQREDPDSVSWKEHQTRLIRLFRKYMTDMSVEAEMERQASRQIRNDIGRNAVEDAVCDCLYPERRNLITYDINLELFRLCSAAVAEPEKATFYASFTDTLALSPEFSLSFSDAAIHEWELLAARSSLRKCLVGTKTQRPRILQALVAVELRLRNMKAVSALLESEIRTDPLALETWRLVVGLEILFGETSDARSMRISAEIDKRQLLFACNTFGDDEVPDLEEISRNPESVTLRGLGLEHIPNAILLQSELTSLDISGNELTELPEGLGRLKTLQQLNASENALINFPLCVSSLTGLKELRLAHNDMSTIRIPALSNLKTMDIRWNAVTQLPVSSLSTLTSLSVLLTEGNTIPEVELSKINDFLSSDKEVIFPSVEVDASGQTLAGEKQDKVTMEGFDGVSTSESTAVEENETLSAATGLESPTPNDTKAPATSAKGATPAAKEDSSDQHGENEYVENVSMSKENGGVQYMELESDESASKLKEDEGQAMDEIAVDSTAAHEEESEDQIVVQDTGSVDVAANDKEEDGDQIMDSVDAASEPKEDDGYQVMSNIEVDGSVTQAPTKVTKPAKEVIDVSLDSPEENEEDTTDRAGQAQPSTANNTEDTVDTANNMIVLLDSSSGDPSTTDSAEAEDFALDHSEDITAEITRRQSSHEEAIIARRKLSVYMEQNDIDDRSEVRKRNPALWLEFLSANLPVNSELPACRLCFAPNDGHNQRFNATVLCVHCLEDALLVLKERNEQGQDAQENV